MVSEETKPLIEVLTSSSGGRIIGHKVGGYRTDPNIVVAGQGTVSEIIYDRLMRLPTLAWMRGSLNLIKLNALEQAGMDFPSGNTLYPAPDDFFFLPYNLDAAYDLAAANEGYWSILRFCTNLGMISGRGIPANQSLPDLEE